MFGFKKKPENDIWQYHVDTVVSGSEKDIRESNAIYSVIKVFDDFPISHPVFFKGGDEALGGGKSSEMRPLTVKQACKFAKKHKLVLEVDPDDKEIFQYVKEHLPRELWKYNTCTKYAKFN